MRAFTLIEALITVAIVSMAVAIGVGALTGATASSSSIQARSDVLELDRLARRASQRVGAVDLVIDQGVASIRRVDDDEPLVRVDIGSVILLDSDGAPAPRIRFGRDGRSPNYRVELLEGDNSTNLYVSGATGLMREAGP